MRLSVQIEFDKTLDLDTNKESVLVGRSDKCDLVVPHDGVSRQHCRIERAQDKFFITDLGSSNGVFIDGKRLEPNKKVPYLPVQQLSLGALECALSDLTSDTDTPANKIVSSQNSGDFTSTIRLARIDLNRPSITLELEKKQVPKGPRNPVTVTKNKARKAVNPKRYVLVIIGIIALFVVWVLGEK